MNWVDNQSLTELSRDLSWREKVTIIRKRYGISLRDIAERFPKTDGSIGTSVEYVSQILRGIQESSPETHSAINHVLGDLIAERDKK